MVSDWAGEGGQGPDRSRPKPLQGILSVILKANGATGRFGGQKSSMIGMHFQ